MHARHRDVDAHSRAGGVRGRRREQDRAVDPALDGVDPGAGHRARRACGHAQLLAAQGDGERQARCPVGRRVGVRSFGHREGGGRGVDGVDERTELATVTRPGDLGEPASGLVVVADDLAVGQRDAAQSAEPVVVVARGERSRVGVRTGHRRDVLGQTAVDVVLEVLGARLVLDVDHPSGGVAGGGVPEVAAVLQLHRLLVRIGDRREQAEVEAEDGADVALLAQDRALLSRLVAGEVVVPGDEAAVGRRRGGPPTQQVVGVGGRETAGGLHPEQLTQPVVGVAREKRHARRGPVLTPQDVVVRVEPRLRVATLRVCHIDGRHRARGAEDLVPVCRPRRRAVGDPFREGPVEGVVGRDRRHGVRRVARVDRVVGERRARLEERLPLVDGTAEAVDVRAALGGEAGPGDPGDGVVDLGVALASGDASRAVGIRRRVDGRARVELVGVRHRRVRVAGVVGVVGEGRDTAVG